MTVEKGAAMLNLKTIAVMIAAMTGFILAPSQGCIAESAHQTGKGGPDIVLNPSRSTISAVPMTASAPDGQAAAPYVVNDRSNGTDESDEPSEEASGARIELVPHVTDGGRNIFIKTPFLFEEGTAEDLEPLWVKRLSLPGLENMAA